MKSVSIAVAILLSTATAAHADSPPATAPNDDPASSSPAWYGWQILAIDAIGVALIAAGDDRPAVGGVGAAALLLGGPAVHALRGRSDKFGGSLALRLALPGIAAGLGMAVGRSRQDPGVDDAMQAARYFGAGLLVGGLAAMAIDGLLLARESAAPAAVERAPALTPRIGVAGDSVSLGLGGWF